MKLQDFLICSLAEACGRVGSEAPAPDVARQLRGSGAGAVCIVGVAPGRDWMETGHARGWLAGVERTPEDFRRRAAQALQAGWVAADAAVMAKMSAAHALPLLSWDEEFPAEPSFAEPPRRLDLYAIVDSAARLRQVLDAGVRTVQLRIKTPPAPDTGWHAMLRDEVRQAVADSRAAGAELFVNDHWRLAHELGASGVHLGQEDLQALGPEGRRALRDTRMALGISSHSLWELARARTLSPRYIACGPVWPTLTKDMPWVPQGLDNLAWWCRAAGAPVTAIGGILGPQEVEQAARTGADGVCVVRGLGEDPRATVPAFAAALAAGRARTIGLQVEIPHPTLRA